MTYPPQQPGYPQQHPQQPGYSQHPQQPGYSQQPPPQQQQPPQQPGLPYHHHGWGQPPQEPPKTGLIVGIVLAAVVIIGGAIAALVVLFTRGDSADGGGGSEAPVAAEDAAAVADRLAGALTDAHAPSLAQLTCDQPNDREARGFELALSSPRVSAEVATPPQVSGDGDRASVVLRIVPEDDTFIGPTDAPYELSNRDGAWCVVFAWEQFERFG